MKIDMKIIRIGNEKSTHFGTKNCTISKDSTNLSTSTGYPSSSSFTLQIRRMLHSLWPAALHQQGPALMGWVFCLQNFSPKVSINNNSGQRQPSYAWKNAAGKMPRITHIYKVDFQTGEGRGRSMAQHNPWNQNTWAQGECVGAPL